MDNNLPPGFTLDQSTPTRDAVTGPSGLPPGFQLDNEKYGTLGQQALTVAEGGGQGAVGPLATLAEAGLTKLGVPGLSPAEQEARAKANPIEHGAAELAGFVGPAILTGGESALAKASLAGITGKVGEAAAKAASMVGINGGSTLSRIAVGGIKTGAEMAALQASDEVSKAINADPGQSIGLAAVGSNIAHAGLYGLIGGAGLGTVGSLFRGTIEKSGLPKIIDDAKAQYDFRQSLPSGDVPSAVTGELNTRLGEMDNIHNNWDNMVGKSIEPAMPEVTSSNTAKIDAQIQGIGSDMTNKIASAEDNAYLRASVPKLRQDFTDFLGVVTNPESTYAQKFQAINDLKRAQWAKGKFSLTAEESALGKYTNSIGNDLKDRLEDTSVWGDAAKVQKDSNAAVSNFLTAQKIAKGKFTAQTMNGLETSQDKVTTLVNQILKGKGIDKTNAISDYLEQSQKLADAINQTHANAGLEAPIRLTPAPALETVLKTKASPGTSLGNWLYDKGLASVIGHAGGQSIGAGLGALAGHPVIGGIIGEKMLAPIMTSIAKPLLENASRASAFRASVDYLGNVIRGGNTVSNATANLFKKGTEIISKNLIPTQDSRDKLMASLDAVNSDPHKMMGVGGELGHYLPDHATAAAAIAAQGVQYLNSLKPTQPVTSPLDRPPPVSAAQQAKYNRALDIAQQPLMVLHHAAQGTLLPQDIQTLQAIYPGLHRKIADELGKNIILSQSKKITIPYKQKMAISMLMGHPLDSTMTPGAMQAIMASSSAKPPQSAQAQAQGSHKGASNVALRQINKVNDLYKTPLDRRVASR